MSSREQKSEATTPTHPPSSGGERLPVQLDNRTTNYCQIRNSNDENNGVSNFHPWSRSNAFKR
jgi:hypothetical protein